MIDVSPSDFLKLHGGLVRVLRAIEQAGPNGLPTRLAGEDVFNSRTYGWHMVKKAEELQYITRKRVQRPGKSGNYYTMNYLTAKGSKLLKELGE